MIKKQYIYIYIVCLNEGIGKNKTSVVNTARMTMQPPLKTLTMKRHMVNQNRVVVTDEMTMVARQGTRARMMTRRRPNSLLQIPRVFLEINIFLLYIFLLLTSYKVSFSVPICIERKKKFFARPAGKRRQKITAMVGISPIHTSPTLYEQVSFCNYRNGKELWLHGIITKVQGVTIKQ
jgi:hypothetical protein